MNSKGLSSPPLMHWLRHVVAMILLVALDFNQRLRRRLNRAFLRVTMVLLCVMLAAIALSSLTALLRIIDSVKSLVGDAMVGVEASVSMRSAMRETRLDLLHLRLENNLRISAKEVETLQQTSSQLLAEYRTGALEDEDRQNASMIEETFKTYLATLRPLIDEPQPSTEAIERADAAGSRVLDMVERAYEYNRDRLHENAEEATVSAKNALRLSNILWWSFAALMVAILLLYFAYRWLAPPEESDG